jgi:hypothetical protein
MLRNTIIEAKLVVAVNFTEEIAGHCFKNLILEHAPKESDASSRQRDALARSPSPISLSKSSLWGGQPERKRPAVKAPTFRRITIQFVTRHFPSSFGLYLSIRLNPASVTFQPHPLLRYGCWHQPVGRSRRAAQPVSTVSMTSILRRRSPAGPVCIIDVRRSRRVA